MEEPGQLKRAFIDATTGAVSGAVSRTVTSPLDVIKIRFQVQLEPTSSWALLRKDVYGTSKYTGMLQATKDIFREEGLAGFWRGNVPALLMVMPYTAIQFTVLHKLKTFAAGSSKTEDHIHLSPYLSYVSGALAGCAATVGSYPFDLIRTILASQGEPKVYPNMRSALVDILRNRGFQGLYAGLSPTLVEIIPYAGLQFGTYDTFKRWSMAWNRSRSSNPNQADDFLSSFQLFLCGLAAGTCAKAVCHPLDVVKKRFQVISYEMNTFEKDKLIVKRNSSSVPVFGLIFISTVCVGAEVNVLSTFFSNEQTVVLYQPSPNIVICKRIINQVLLLSLVKSLATINLIVSLLSEMRVLFLSVTSQNESCNVPNPSPLQDVILVTDYVKSTCS